MGFKSRLLSSVRAMLDEHSPMLDILSAYLAMHTSAKRYHWKTQGPLFEGDHLLFDRIASEYDSDLADKIVEENYMGIHRENLNEVDYIVENSVKFETEKMVCNSIKDATEMASNLQTLVEICIKMVNDYKSNDRGINADLDALGSHLTNSLGLLKGRTGLSKLDSFASLVLAGGISEDTWNKMSSKEKTMYVKEHPNSKYASVKIEKDSLPNKSKVKIKISDLKDRGIKNNKEARAVWTALEKLDTKIENEKDKEVKKKLISKLKVLEELHKTYKDKKEKANSKKQDKANKK